MEWNSLCKGENPEARTSCKGNHLHKEDDIEGKLINHFGSMFISKTSFAEHLKSERKKFKPIGRLVASFTRNLSILSPTS
jgi:hypothetical protein